MKVKKENKALNIKTKKEEKKSIFGYKETMIKYINKQDLIKITDLWRKKTFDHVYSKYKKFITERNFNKNDLIDLINDSLRKVDFESVPITSFFLSMEKLVLKKLSKLEIKSVRIPFEEQMRLVRPYSVGGNVQNRYKIQSNNHQKQQILKNQRKNDPG